MNKLSNCYKLSKGKGANFYIIKNLFYFED